MNQFVDAIQNKTFTENGALTNVSSNNPVLDLFFHGGALRKGKRPEAIVEMFQKAFNHDPTSALRCLFYLRDVRGGQGERAIFRMAMRDFAKYVPEWFTSANITLIAEYGRWDDVVDLLNLEQIQSNVEVLKSVIVVLAEQFTLDKQCAVLSTKMEGFRGPSLLAKWLPSPSTKNKNKKRLANLLVKSGLFGDERTFRKDLAKLRRTLRVVEINIATKEYASIDYSKLPSKAQIKYRNAFLRHDEDRRRAWLGALTKGEAKINTGTLYPYDILRETRKHGRDTTLEEAWKHLPDYVGDLKGLVVADVSSSMHGDPIDVCISLAMYIAERNKNEAFKDMFITFSQQPQLQMIQGSTLFEKYRNMSMAHWEMNTNLQAVFLLVLDRAVSKKVPAEDMPNMLLIVSDMEFDEADRGMLTNLEVIRQRYEESGYKMPRMVFWNVASRNTQTPGTTNDKGVYLVSGMSPVILKYVLTLGADKGMEDLMYETINSERYLPIKY